MNKISKHVSYREGVYSTTALRLGLNNDPSDDHLQNMKLLSEKIFEPLRIHVGGPVKINSFYRGPEFGDDTNPNWVHVSYVDPGSNRNRCLKALRKDGKTSYEVI